MEGGTIYFLLINIHFHFHIKKLDSLKRDNMVGLKMRELVTGPD